MHLLKQANFMQVNNEEDKKLFKQIKAGNNLAFNTLFDRYYVELCDFSFRIMGHKEIAEEVVADVFANIWLKRNHIFINTSLRAFLYRSTKNMTISYLRKKKNDILPLDDIIDFQSNLGPKPDDDMIYEESLNSMERLLLHIPNKSRIVFKMHRFDNLKYREIAEVLDISQKTVEKHMGKALKILRTFNVEAVSGIIAAILFFPF